MSILVRAPTVLCKENPMLLGNTLVLNLLLIVHFEYIQPNQIRSVYSENSNTDDKLDSICVSKGVRQ
ncbi:hypothetical protein BH18THE2_BH18THE2_30880 [soil metagenome]